MQVTVTASAQGLASLLMVEYVQNLAIKNYALHIGHVLGVADVRGNAYSLSMVPEADRSGPSTSMLGIPLCAN